MGCQVSADGSVCRMCQMTRACNVQEVPSKQAAILLGVEHEDKRSAQEPWLQSGFHPGSLRPQRLYGH